MRTVVRLGLLLSLGYRRSTRMNLIRSNPIMSRLLAVVLTGTGLLGGLAGCKDAGQGAATGAGVDVLFDSDITEQM